MHVSSLAEPIAEPELAGVESTVAVAQVVGDTEQAVAVHTEPAAESREGLLLRRYTGQDHVLHRLS